MLHQCRILAAIVTLALLTGLSILAQDVSSGENKGAAAGSSALWGAVYADAETVSCLGFETGWDDWEVSNGIWEIGYPDSVVVPHFGDSCAGTVLNGPYPDGADSRLATPAINLPTISSGEELRLRLWHWFTLGAADPCFVEISVDSAGGWQPWRTIYGDYAGISPYWTPAEVDISSDAGKRVKFGFHFLETGAEEGWGYYLDDICVLKSSGSIVAPCTLDFESGWGDWWASKGIWEVGHSDSVAAHSGQNCAGTALNDLFPSHHAAQSYLVGPPIEFPSIGGGEELRLKFWHWLEFVGYAYGQVEISVDSAGGWQPWRVLSYYDRHVNKLYWSQEDIEISTDAGKRVRIGFYFFFGNYSNPDGLGWYLDDITFQCPVPDAPVLISPLNGIPSLPDLTFYWHKLLRATCYRVQIAYDSLFTTIRNNLPEILDTTCSLTGLPTDTTMWWRVRGESVCGAGAWSEIWQFTDVEELDDEEGNMPAGFALRQNYPNPFNPQTRIKYALAKATQVKIVIYNLLGQRVKTLVDERQTAGHQETLWDGKDEKGNEVASGIYFYQLKAGQFKQTRRMVLIR